jgi:hypothetical protein
MYFSRCNCPYFSEAHGLHLLAASPLSSLPNHRPTEPIPVAGTLLVMRGGSAGRRRGMMLTIAPCTTRAVFVKLLPAGPAHHVPIIALADPGRPVRQPREASEPAGSPRGASQPAPIGWPAQAALARRIRRRRSEDRSSSFSPPQVPYFSGRLSA